ncbi:MAG: dTDP-4-dehydrorhamnose reductase [Firmicutes bacterium]|nr:dTDP-4-dehydrorhamnose reductase [Bacillota bacterium]
MRVLITGAAGLLGRQAAAVCRQRRDEVYALARHELDITSWDDVSRAVREVRPAVVYNCAAYTDVDGAETEREKAFAVNGLGPRNLALACRAQEAVLVHVSTDYVFPGDSRRPYLVYDRTGPLNTYGESKLFGEEAVREAGGRFIIARTSWLFGPGGKNFVDTIAGLAAEKESLKVVDDQRGSPTYTADLARALTGLALSGRYGTYHVTNSGATTWYGLACKIVAVLGLPARVEPCATDEFPRPARRPGYSVMDPFPLKETLGYLPPPWEDAVERHLLGRHGGRHGDGSCV